MASATLRRTGTKGVPRAEREQQILDESTRLFGLNTFAGTSVAQIAEAAGISKPLIYSYFGSKEGLFAACVEHHGALLADEIERIARGDSVGLIRGLNTLQGIFALLEPNPLTWRIFFDATAPSDPSLDAAKNAYAQRITTLADEGVREMLTLNGVTDELDISALTSVWMSIVDSLVNWWLDHPDQSPEDMTARCARLFLAVAPGAL